MYSLELEHLCTQISPQRRFTAKGRGEEIHRFSGLKGFSEGFKNDSTAKSISPRRTQRAQRAEGEELQRIFS
jgi:hypothetical protein